MKPRKDVIQSPVLVIHKNVLNIRNKKIITAVCYASLHVTFFNPLFCQKNIMQHLTATMGCRPIFCVRTHLFPPLRRRCDIAPKSILWSVLLHLAEAMSQQHRSQITLQRIQSDITDASLSLNVNGILTSEDWMSYRFWCCWCWRWCSVCMKRLKVNILGHLDAVPAAGGVYIPLNAVVFFFKRFV